MFIHSENHFFVVCCSL
ncbi:hypothetical protein Pint_30025 [Pistacia integerrima]|uniref:Uncharacterized protein n=1 Tax=Pistacia integerrima TaxID=434235 RepID=A0ACC0X0Y0_9ROSI|nr:hypothetical protein Pint_30025 [Pistacia integerrima]